MLAARIMQHIPERANQLTSSRSHFTLGAHHEREESWTTGRGAHGRQRCLAENTMIFTIICFVGLVGSFVMTAHAIWVRGI
jgi:hypothetical protein